VAPIVRKWRKRRREGGERGRERENERRRRRDWRCKLRENRSWNSWKLELGAQLRRQGKRGSPMRPSSMPSCPTTCFDFVISPHSSTMSLRSLCSPLSGASFASWCLRRGVSEGALLKTAHPYPNRHLRLLPLVAQSGKWSQEQEQSERRIMSCCVYL
jgi:hypothetical protein